MRTRNVWAVLLASALTTVMRSDAALPSAAIERSRPDAIDASQTATVTFTKDIAPIVFGHCASCHRPGGDGPFSLLTYDEVKARARLIVKAATSRFMPPWKPEPGYGAFAAVRRLSDEHIQLIRRWVDQGTIQGDLADLPPLPESQAGQKWRLGEPDLVVSMPAYTLRADGAEMFRAFVVPIPTSVRRFVRAWEFRPGNRRVVHHATIEIDTTDASRRRDEEDPAPGFEGIVPHSAQIPDGYFPGWIPGQTAVAVDEDMAWPLETGSDLVLMLHMRPSGKVETVQASLGLYFSRTPATRVPVVVRLTRQNLDIPAGESHYTVTNSYTLPVDVDAYRVQAHAHWLARDVKAFATLPNGTTEPLIFIKDWDFNWQDVYSFAKPVFLPAGSTIVMDWTYDNSAANPRNPHNPPQRVTWGQQTANEMSELRLQVLPRDRANRPLLARDLHAKVLPEDIAGLEMMLKADPDGVGLHDDVALLYAEAGNLEQAVAHFRESLRVRPQSAAAHYNVGTALMRQERLEEAGEQFRQALELNPDYAKAHRNLGTVLHLGNNLGEAADHYRKAILLAPADAEAHYQLGLVLQSQSKSSDAIAHYRETLRLDPEHAEAHYNLAGALQSQNQLTEAVQHYRWALRSRPDWPAPLIELAWIAATFPQPPLRDPEAAIRLAERAATLTKFQDLKSLEALATALAAAGKFDRAVTTVETALTLARARQDPDMVSRFLRQLELYRQRKP